MKYWISFVLLAAPASAAAQSVVVGNGAREDVLGGATVTLASAGALIDVQSGGTLAYGGTSATVQACFVGPTAAAPISVQSGGTLDLRFAKLQNITTVTIAAGGTLLRAKDVVFQDLAGWTPNAPWLDVSAMTASDRDRLPFSLNRITFTWVAGTRTNVKAGANTPVLRMLGNTTAGGNRWGSTYENDPSSNVFWHTGAVVRSTDGFSFDTLEEALKDAGTTASSVLTLGLGATSFIDDYVDWNTNAAASATGPTIKKANLAPLVGATVVDTDGGTGRRGKLINCVIGRGSVDETSAVNCTFFWPGAGQITVSNTDGISVLIENGNPGTGNTLTTSVTTATAAFFISDTSYNFHLAWPGGAAAIDAGSGSAEPMDFEDEPRGFDGDGSGSGTIDAGADELIFPRPTTLAHRTVDTSPVFQGTAVSGTVGYTVGFFRNGVLVSTTTVPANSVLSFEDTVQPEGSYTYTMAYLYGGFSTGTAWSVVVTVDLTPPAAPTDLVATPKNGAVDLEWTASTSGDVLGYQVHRSTNGSSFSLLTPAGQLVTGTKYRDTAVTNGTQYWYRVTACDGALPQ